MRNQLVDLVPPSPERLVILVVDGSKDLVRLRDLCPHAEIHAVTPYEEVAAHEAGAALGIFWHVFDWRHDPLPFAEETFDRILAEFALESACEPYETLMVLNRCLKETGTLYTSYTNIRYHRILAALQEGEFPVRGDRHLYAKPETVRLLNAALYKEIHFFPGEQDDDLTLANAWAEEGFANVSSDLATRTWLIRAERSTSAASNLKLLFSRETRRKTARLLHRIEYDIEPAESLAALHSLCRREGIFRDYLSDFVTEVCIHRAHVHSALHDLFGEI